MLCSEPYIVGGYVMFVNKFDESLFFIVIGIDILITLLFSGLVGTSDFGVERYLCLIACLIIAACDFFCHVRNKKKSERVYSYDISKKSFFVFPMQFLIFFGVHITFLIEFIEKKNSIMDFNINSHYLAPFVFRYVILFFTIVPFITDFTLVKRKVYKSVLTFLPILFLLPNYIGVWADDKSIIKLISVCVACFIGFKLNVRPLLKALILSSFILVILLFPAINILIPICILISIFLILQFSNENKNYFVLAILFGIAMIRILIFTFPVVFNLLNISSEFYSKASSLHIGGGSALGLSLSGYELFISLFTVVPIFVFITKNIRYAYPLLFFSFVYSIYLQAFPLLLERLPTVALHVRFVLLLSFGIILFFTGRYFFNKTETE